MISLLLLPFQPPSLVLSLGPLRALAFFDLNQLNLELRSKQGKLSLLKPDQLDQQLELKLSEVMLLKLVPLLPLPFSMMLLQLKDLEPCEGKLWQEGMLALFLLEPSLHEQWWN